MAEDNKVVPLKWGDGGRIIGYTEVTDEGLVGYVTDKDVIQELFVPVTGGVSIEYLEHELPPNYD